MVLRGCVWVGAKFLKPWQVKDNIIEWIFMQVTFNILWVTLTQKIITHRVLKIHKWFWGDVYESGESFSKPWEETDKIIEWIFSQFTFNILWVTLTQKIITHRVLKIHEWFWGDVYESGESFLNHDKWQIKLLSEFFPNSHSTFYEWL